MYLIFDLHFKKHQIPPSLSAPFPTWLSSSKCLGHIFCRLSNILNNTGDLKLPHYSNTFQILEFPQNKTPNWYHPPSLFANIISLCLFITPIFQYNPMPFCKPLPISNVDFLHIKWPISRALSSAGVPWSGENWFAACTGGWQTTGLWFKGSLPPDSWPAGSVSRQPGSCHGTTVQLHFALACPCAQIHFSCHMLYNSRRQATKGVLSEWVVASVKEKLPMCTIWVNLLFSYW